MEDMTNKRELYRIEYIDNENYTKWIYVLGNNMHQTLNRVEEYLIFTYATTDGVMNASIQSCKKVACNNPKGSETLFKDYTNKWATNSGNDYTVNPNNRSSFSASSVDWPDAKSITDKF